MVKKIALSGIKKILIFILLSSLSFDELFAQQRVAEINLDGANVANLRGLVSDDSIFLNYSRFRLQRPSVNHNVWISPEGRVRQIDLSDLETKILFGITYEKDTTRYYFLDEDKNNVLIKSLAYAERTGVKVIGEKTVMLPGRLLGSYVDKDLYIICASKKDFSIKVIQINKHDVVAEKVFKLANDILRRNDRTISFIEEGKPVIIEQAIAPIKILKFTDAIYITVDEPFQQYAANQGLYKTTLMRLDLAANTVSTKVFFESSQSYFNSIVFDNQLYKVVTEAGHLKVEIFNAETGKLLHSRLFNEPKKSIAVEVYSRTKSRITKEIRNAPFKSPALQGFIMVDSVESNLELTIGVWQEEKSGGIFVPSIFGFIPMLIAGIATTVIRDLNEGPINTSFFIMQGSVDRGFHYTKEAKSPRRQIDEFERLNPIPKFRYRGYLNHNNGVYSINQRDDSDKLEILSFNRQIE